MVEDDPAQEDKNGQLAARLDGLERALRDQTARLHAIEQRLNLDSPPAAPRGELIEPRESSSKAPTLPHITPEPARPAESFETASRHLEAEESGPPPRSD